MCVDMRAGVVAYVEAWGYLLVSMSLLACAMVLDETQVNGLPQQVPLPTDRKRFI